MEMRVLRFWITCGQWVVDKVEGDFKIKTSKIVNDFSRAVLKPSSVLFLGGFSQGMRVKAISKEMMELGSYPRSLLLQSLCRSEHHRQCYSLSSLTLHSIVFFAFIVALIWLPSLRWVRLAKRKAIIKILMKKVLLF